ncbi:MAG TPA: ATP synthase F1 subunit epsilon [Thermomicrobiales bacterium]|jgi:F-type H+-transporting ATPase subunit epsilon|nr:ATP synthase F1 subunit epsilon [Thermomicrobiales bacterium]
MAKLTVEIITGERRIFNETDIDMVIAKGIDGMLGILPRHTPLITPLAPGELRIKRGGREDSLVIFGGILEVNEGKIIILADSAENSDEIDIAQAEEARRKAQESLANRGSAEDAKAAEADLARAEMRLRLGGRRRSTGTSG